MWTRRAGDHEGSIIRRDNRLDWSPGLYISRLSNAMLIMGVVGWKDAFILYGIATNYPDQGAKLVQRSLVEATIFQPFAAAIVIESRVQQML